MNDSPFTPQRLDDLFARARAQRADTSRAEYAFETRLLSRLRARRQQGGASLLGRVSWRMVPFFAMAVIALAMWNGEAASNADEDAGLSLLQHPETADLPGDAN